MRELLDRLRQQHRDIGVLLEMLSAEVGRIERAGDPDYDVLTMALEYLDVHLELYHHYNEDLLYDRLLRRDAAAAARVGDIRAAHAILGSRVREFARGLRAVLTEAEISRPALVKWARDFIALQAQHMAMENEKLFPAAERALTAADWKHIGKAAKTGPDPLFGKSADVRFGHLRDAISVWRENESRVGENRAGAA